MAVPAPAVPAPNPLATMMSPGQAGAMVTNAISSGYANTGRDLENKLTQLKLDAQTAAGNALTQANGDPDAAAQAVISNPSLSPAAQGQTLQNLYAMKQQQAAAGQAQAENIIKHVPIWQATAQSIADMPNPSLDDVRQAVTAHLPDDPSNPQPGDIDAGTAAKTLQEAAGIGNDPQAIKQWAAGKVRNYQVMIDGARAVLPSLQPVNAGNRIVNQDTNPLSPTFTGANSSIATGISPSEAAPHVSVNTPTGTLSGLATPGAAPSNMVQTPGSALPSTAAPTINQGTPVPPSVGIDAAQLANSPVGPAIATAAGPQAPVPANMTPTNKADQEAMQGTGAAASAREQQIAAAAQGVPQNRALFGNMLNELNDFSSGPGADSYANATAAVKANLSRLGITPADSSDLTAHDAFRKNSQLLINGITASLGGVATPDKLDAAAHSSPSTELVNASDKELIQQLSGLQDYAAAKNQAWQTSATRAQNPANINQWEAQFNANTDPRVFQMQYMSPQERTQLIASVKNNPTDKARLANAIRYSQQNGLIPNGQ